MAKDREIQFPEPLIQLLQSFLTGEEAARTAIVSKSWHSAWLTRPNLDFDDTYFEDDDFSEYAEKTIKRYEQLNLKIESFNICMNINHKSRAELANKLIVKALRIGASRLYLRLKRDDSFVLTNEVFGADNLVELSIDLDDGVDIQCRRLESLSLDDVVFMRYDKVRNIISSCPSIKNLSLLSDVYPHDYWKLWYFEHEDDEELDERAMAVGLVDNLIPRLRCLVLGSESFRTLCLGDLLSRFSFLKDFTLYLNNDINIYEEIIQISNSSIERIKLVQVLNFFPDYGYVRRPRLKFDVPSVRKFTYEGISIPRLSFISTPSSREWESHVSIQCKNDEFPTCWFNDLSELLTKLSQSKTHLSLHSGGKLTAFDYKVGDNIIEGLRKHELENLTLDMTNLLYSSCYPLFDGLFRLCRPKLITQYYKDDPYKNGSYMEKTNIDLLCRILEKGINIRVLKPTQFMYGLNDLEEVNAQINFDVDDILSEWMPIPFELLLDYDSPHKYVQPKQRICLLLKWKPI